MNVLSIGAMCLVVLSVEIIGGVLVGSVAALTIPAHLVSRFSFYALDHFVATRRRARGAFLRALVAISLSTAIPGGLCAWAIVLLGSPPSLNGRALFSVALAGLVLNAFTSWALRSPHKADSGAGGDADQARGHPLYEPAAVHVSPIRHSHRTVSPVLVHGPSLEVSSSGSDSDFETASILAVSTKLHQPSSPLPGIRAWNERVVAAHMRHLPVAGKMRHASHQSPAVGSTRPTVTVPPSSSTPLLLSQQQPPAPPPSPSSSSTLSCAVEQPPLPSSFASGYESDDEKSMSSSTASDSSADSEHERDDGNAPTCANVMGCACLGSFCLLDVNPERVVQVGMFLRVCVFGLFCFCSDLVQSLIVVSAGVALWIRPQWRLCDPIAAIASSVMVISLTAARTIGAMRALLKSPPPPAFSARPCTVV